MTNKEKVDSILKFFHGSRTLQDLLLEMAKWKDEQYKEEKKELLGLVNLLHVDEHNQTIIEDLKALLK